MSEPKNFHLGLVAGPCPACGGADRMCADCAQERIRQLEDVRDALEKLTVAQDVALRDTQAEVERLLNMRGPGD